MAWHPLGHMLATGSNDLTIRFWTQSKASAGRQRQQPGSTTAVAVPEGEFSLWRHLKPTVTWWSSLLTDPAMHQVTADEHGP